MARLCPNPIESVMSVFAQYGIGMGHALGGQRFDYKSTAPSAALSKATVGGGADSVEEGNSEGEGAAATETGEEAAGITEEEEEGSTADTAKTEEAKTGAGEVCEAGETEASMAEGGLEEESEVDFACGTTPDDEVWVSETSGLAGLLSGFI